jgi:murein DD-endopeptidase MepM/ murein hydrolase activator NlpD
VFFLIVPLFHVRASFFSFLSNLLGLDEENEIIKENIQTISLLEPINSIDPGADKGGGEIAIVSNALLSDSGPMGTVADIFANKPSPDQISLYVVRKGDTLTEIAKLFNVSVNTIRWANNLKQEDTIAIGQVLVILPVTGVQYTVAKGDTPQSLAKKFSADANEILEFNGLTSTEDLSVGQTIIIPNGDYTEPAAPQPIVKKPVYTPIPYQAGYYLRPIAGGRKSQGIHGYNAVDLADSCGTPIMASAGGDVIIARSSGWNAGYGSYVVISHPNGSQTLYAHMSSVAVSPGWHVARGQIIGYIGVTGRTTGCHVHFEIRNGPRNPF